MEKLQDVISVESLSFKQKFAFLDSVCAALLKCHPEDETLLGQNEGETGNFKVNILAYQEEVKYIIDSLV